MTTGSCSTRPDMLPKISQGVTTVVTGNCGISLAPVTFKRRPAGADEPARRREKPTSSRRFADYARAIARDGAGRQRRGADRPFVAAPRHHGGRPRQGDDARDRRHARPRRRGDGERRDRLLHRPLYKTNAAADVDEVARVAARFAKHGGVYATHMRDEMEPVLDSLDETLDDRAAAPTCRW